MCFHSLLYNPVTNTYIPQIFFWVEKQYRGIYNHTLQFNLCFLIFIASPPTPSITPTGEQHIIEENDNLTLTCLAHCQPECSFSWSKDSGPTISNESQLVLSFIRRNQQGRYTCTVDNKIPPSAFQESLVFVKCK